MKVLRIGSLAALLAAVVAAGGSPDLGAGDRVPDFTLKDTDGKEVRLSDFTGRVCGKCNGGPMLKQGSCCHKAIQEGKRCENECCKEAGAGNRIVVLQWINPGCPFCKRVVTGGALKKMLKDLKEADPNAVHIAINSTHYMEPDESAKYFRENRIPSAILVDRDGKVGKLLGAKTTPHMFVIDANCVLRYDGAFDDDKGGRRGDKAVNYVVEAVKKIVKGEKVEPSQTAPYGCSVKYKN